MFWTYDYVDLYKIEMYTKPISNIDVFYDNETSSLLHSKLFMKKILSKKFVQPNSILTKREFEKWSLWETQKRKS